MNTTLFLDGLHDTKTQFFNVTKQLMYDDVLDSTRPKNTHKLSVPSTMFRTNHHLGDVLMFSKMT